MAYDRHTSAGILEHTPKCPSIRGSDIVKRPLSWQKLSAPAVAASSCAVHENVEQLSYRLYRQRIRSRESSPYNSHPRVRSAEPQNAPASLHHPTTRQEGACPWGMPDLPPPSPYRRRRPQRHDEPSFKPDLGRITMNSKAWTPDEKRTLYLAATHSRLPHQWSKIRVMTNLHRSDQEIETEYLKLFEHRATTGPEDQNEERGRTAARGQYDRDGHSPDDVDRGTDADADADADDDDNKNERSRLMGYYGGEPRLLSMDTRARQLLRMSVARRRSQYRSAVSPRHGPPEPIRVQRFQLEKIPLRI
ncbi:unnamed protein product [Mortierella alpina]